MFAPDDPLRLHGLRILLVEDEFLIADTLALSLERAGGEVVGPVGSLEEGSALAGSAEFHAAILDVNLRGKTSFPIADILQGRGIPFVFVTGYLSASSFPEHLRDVQRILKPFDVIALGIAVRDLVQFK